MSKNIELDTKILNKNLEITKLTQQTDDLISKNVELISENVELKEKYNNKILDERKVLNQVIDLTKNNQNLYNLLTEVHERMYPMMEHCERLQPVKLDMDEIPPTGSEDNGLYPITVDLTLEEHDEEEIFTTRLFRLVDKEDMTSYDDQTSRSILKDLRKVIKSLEK